MDYELRPCAHCSGDAEMRRTKGMDYFVKCANPWCGMRTKSCHENETGAAEIWNQRRGEEGRTQEKWTPVGERMPGSDEYVLVSLKTKSGRKSVTRSYWSGSYWAGVRSEAEAWMPLPEPFGGAE